MYNLCLTLGALAAQITTVIATRMPSAAVGGTGGNNSCCIAQKLIAPCSDVPGECNDSLAPFRGTNCTCNTVVFNLWSACLQSQDEAPLPFEQWTAPCAGNNTQVTYGDYPMHSAAKGVQIPTWAYVNVTADGQYDSDAVNDKAAGGWSTSAILAPVLLGISLLACFVLVLWWYRRHLRIKYGTKSVKRRNILSWFRMLRIWPNSADSAASRTAVVGSGGSTWTIDDFESAMMHQGRLSPDSDEDSHFIFDTLAPAPSFPFSASAPQLFNPAHANGQHVRPLGKARKDSGSPTRVPFSTASSSGSSFWRNPFKKGPKKVTFTPARRGFRVDETDLSTSAAESRRPTLTASSLGHGSVARREDRERERERERLAGVREGEGIEGEGVAEDSVLLISHATSIPSPPSSPPQHPQEPQAAPSPTSPTSTASPALSPRQHVQEPHPAPPAVKLVVIPPSRAGTFKVHHPALASSPTLPLATPVAPPSPRTPPPTHTSMTAPATASSPRLLRPLPPPPPPLSSPPSYNSHSHPPPLHSILIPNHITHAGPSPSPVEPASPPYSHSPSRNASPLLRAHSRTVSAESVGLVGLVRPARADPINLVPASVRAAGYNPYAGTSQPNLGLGAGAHSRSPSDGSEGTPARESLWPPPFS